MKEKDRNKLPKKKSFYFKDYTESEIIFNNKNITLENAYAGVYFIKIYSGNTILTKKIIKI